jgi:long-subunit fatty acid transport protein
MVNVVSGYTGLFGDPEDPDLDILSEITLQSFTAFGGNIGAWWKAAPFLEAAVSVQSPIKFSDDAAELRTRLPSSPVFNNAQVEGNTIAGSLSYPAIFRFGLRLVQETFDIEAAVVYEMWSVVDAIEASPNDIAVTGVPGLGSIPVGPLNVPLNWQNTLSLRLGSDIQLTDSFILRGGYGFETATVPDEYYSVFLADGTKHHLALGAGLNFGAITLDASLSYYLIPTRTITNSQVNQINPTDEENKITLVVGNGTYEQSYFIGGLAFNYQF